MVDATLGIPMEDERPQGRQFDKARQQIDARHKALRGTDALLYYPPEDACKALCGHLDNNMAWKDNPPMWTQHQCFYAPEHKGPCKFSSECKRSKRKEVVDELSGFGAA